MSVVPVPESDSQELKIYPLDLAKFISENGGEKKFLANRAIKQYLDNLKVTMFI